MAASSSDCVKTPFAINTFAKAEPRLKLAFSHEDIGQMDQHFAGNRDPAVGRTQTAKDFAGQGFDSADPQQGGAESVGQDSTRAAIL